MITAALHSLPLVGVSWRDKIRCMSVTRYVHSSNAYLGDTLATRRVFAWTTYMVLDIVYHCMVLAIVYQYWFVIVEECHFSEGISW